MKKTQDKIETAKSTPMSLDLDSETPEEKVVEKVPAPWLLLFVCSSTLLRDCRDFVEEPS